MSTSDADLLSVWHELDDATTTLTKLREIYHRTRCPELKRELPKLAYRVDELIRRLSLGLANATKEELFTFAEGGVE